MPPIIRPPRSPIASPAQTRADSQPGAGVTVISSNRRFTVTASKAPAVQTPLGNWPPGIDQLAQSLGLEPVFGATKKQPRVYTLQASAAAEEPGRTALPGPSEEQ